MTTRRYQIEHLTRYIYPSPVSVSCQLLHVRPRVHPRQDAESCVLQVDPPVESPGGVQEQWDTFGNPVTRLALETVHDHLQVRVITRLGIRPRGALIMDGIPDWTALRDSLVYRGQPLTPGMLEACRFRVESPHVPLKGCFERFARPCFVPGRSVLAGAMALMEQIYTTFTYDPEATQIATPLTDVLRLQRGVCQDFAHLMIAGLRSLGLPARYVSGYLLTHPPAGQPRLVGADASHAWVSVWCPVNGWVDFDPTNNVLPDQEHITLAWGRDFSDVSPLRGIILGGTAQPPDVEVTVTPLTA